MSEFLCMHCGAPLAVPSEEDALDARCGFCGDSTPLPEDILALRRPKVIVVHDGDDGGRGRGRAKSLRSALGAAVAVIGIGVATVSASHARGPQAPVAKTSSSPSASALRVRPDRDANGEARASELMKGFYARGCKHVIMPPSQTSGARMLRTKFAMNGRCVQVIAVSGVADNALTITMKSPLGEVLPTPPPGPELDFTVCPKMAGEHPTSIIPKTGDTYTVAAIECPAPKTKTKTP